MTPPPGWYPDPSAPHLERWWDGTAWTDHHRHPEASGGPTPDHAPAAGPPHGDGESVRAKAIALTVAGAVLVAAVVTASLVLIDGDPEGDTPRADPAPTATTHGGEPTRTTARQPSPPTEDPNVVVDQLNGLTFPVLDGWERVDSSVEDNAVLRTDGSYDCPGAGSLCRHGLVMSRTVTENAETSPEALARGDIETAADEAYDRNPLDQRPYGGVESTEEIAAGPVAVAGRAGYYVRWRVGTALGPGGYVQSLAFRSSTGTQAPVIVRTVLDAGPEAPPLTDIDRITRGIRSIDDTATGGGVGTSMGPSD
ncbi:DUF2510 domain-containing protein [Streptomyces sp. NPDC088789]|uniref:DUF2510 domain-containing protein n=1 Tax=Streptomyces sp. NPDC088789 TaxID=3365899 RepID=UPI0037F759D7